MAEKQTTVIRISGEKPITFIADCPSKKFPYGLRADVIRELEGLDWYVEDDTIRYKLYLCEDVERGTETDEISLPLYSRGNDLYESDRDNGYIHVTGWKEKE